ncbi:MAG: Cys-tRNA(Pro) deacylase [Anaerolineaceae bacterium]|nr:Cys-tRNA(Pro) deacylase [Anaerolineaceae bacterium]
MQEKTTAMRILDSAGITYQNHEYETSEAASGLEVARLLGKDPETIFKTLVTTGKSGRHYVFMIPASANLDMKKAAQVCGEKSIEMLKSKDLLTLTGYVHGGCSPIGMRKTFPTFIDELAIILKTIVISAGKIGHQVEMPLADLQKVIHVIPADLSVQ